MTEQTMIERMAAALDTEIGRQWKEKPMLNVTGLARAVLAAMREPTEAMMNALEPITCIHGNVWPAPAETWQIMIEAATD